MCKEKIRTLSQSGAEKIAFSPKSDGHTDRRIHIGNYRVASLLNTRDVVKSNRNVFAYKLRNHAATHHT